jgi:hypothetical protein
MREVLETEIVMVVDGINSNVAIGSMTPREQRTLSSSIRQYVAKCNGRRVIDNDKEAARMGERLAKAQVALEKAQAKVNRCKPADFKQAAEVSNA